ncbi:MAG: hypothetical protein OEU94_09500 [Aquincola sp.]|nr:hypothetical protein [Aquincola sp.]
MNADGIPASTALRRVAAACLALMFAVLCASALLRHFGAAPVLQATWASELGWVRQVHRVAATLVLLGAVAMVWMAWRSRHRSDPSFALASALLGLAVLLSVLGVAAGASRAPLVVLANLMGGLAMLGLCARLALEPRRRGVGRIAGVMLAFVALQAAAGALASTSANPECVGVVDCGAWALVHRVGGLVLACALLLFGMMATWATGRQAAVGLVGVALGLWLVGASAAALGSLAVPGVVVAHNLLVAMAVACTARLV